MKIPDQPFSFRSRAEWRAWLQEHGKVERAAWLVLKKSHVQSPGLFYDEAVEEALCFGWIDGVMKSLGTEAYLLRFSPRTHKSVWSVKNQARVARLIESGLMTEAGRSKIREAQENGAWDDAIQRENIANVPGDLQEALADNPLAQTNFAQLPASIKKQFLSWIWSAKTRATREKRIQATVEMVANKKRLGMP